MNNRANDNPQKWLRRIRWFITVFAVGYLYYELFIHHNIRDIANYASEVFGSNPWPLLIVLVLMPVNWLIESFKWKYLMSTIRPIALWEAVKGILMGVSIGLFTPNGIGEFAGRMVVVPKPHRESSISASIAGSMAQLAITITIGGACVVYFISELVAPNAEILALVVTSITIVVGFILYFRMPFVVRKLFNRIPWFKNHQDFVNAFDKFSKRSLVSAYIISLLRYIVFCTQVFVLIYYTVDFEVALSPMKLFFLIPVFFYVQTLIPTIALGEVGIRGAVLIYLLPHAANTLPILMATTAIWLINIVAPALMGLGISFTQKLKAEA